MGTQLAPEETPHETISPHVRAVGQPWLAGGATTRPAAACSDSCATRGRGGGGTTTCSGSLGGAEASMLGLWHAAADDPLSMPAKARASLVHPLHHLGHHHVGRQAPGCRRRWQHDLLLRSQIPTRTWRSQ